MRLTSEKFLRYGYVVLIKVEPYLPSCAIVLAFATLAHVLLGYTDHNWELGSLAITYLVLWAIVRWTIEILRTFLQIEDD